MAHFNDRPLGERVTIIIAAAVLINVLLIAIPGYFSHDELDWRNRIATGNDPWGFDLANLRLSPFFRPLGAAAISLALRLPLQPFASHAALVLLQSLNCCLLYGLVCCFRPDRAFAAALLFAAMPGAAFAAGWIAAGFDMEFTFFALCSLGAAVCFWRRGHWSWGTLSVVAFIAGLLCKETAITIPVAAAGLAFCDRARLDRRRVAVLSAAAVGIVLTYLLLRLPTLVHLGSGADGNAGGYAFGRFANMGSNALAYFTFPFLATAPEVGNLLDQPLVRILPSIGCHIALIVILYLRHGWLAPVLYVMGYFVTLLPVLVISKYETQYLYASSIAISIALTLAWRRQPGYAVPTVVLASILCLHTARIQYAMYMTGACQTRVLQTTEAVLPLVKSPGAAVVYAPGGTPAWVLARALFQNPFHVDGRQVDVTISRQPDAATMRFLPDCSVTLNDRL